MILRRGGPNDVRFLRDMLRHAYYWRDLAEGLPVSRYVDRWGAPGDTAVVALEGMHPVGAAWYRLFPREAPGYGFVDEQTPELTIAVSPARRGKGVGSALMTELLARARADGFPALSLSVREDEPARELYERYGFVKVGEDAVEDGGAWTMRAALS